MLKTKHTDDEGRCKFNLWINCINYKGCEKCGWNPKVAKERKSELVERKEQFDGIAENNTSVEH